MTKRFNVCRNVFILTAAAILILDAKTAALGVKEGMMLCMEAVIPALFPFLFLSGMLNRILAGQPNRFLLPLGKLCRIPTGSEGILLTGLIGGYPVGASMVAQACKDGSLSRDDGRRMLGFCNQAGPAFIFGMLGPMVDSPALPWLIWGLMILSAVITAVMLPGKSDGRSSPKHYAETSLVNALANAIRTMATVCGWVILFRVVLVFVRRWFLWLFPVSIQVFLTGFLELSNGCSALKGLDPPCLILILSGWMLSFGGICVGMQTMSVCRGLDTGLYFPGKLLQSCINCLLSILFSLLIFPNTVAYIPWQLPVFVLSVAAVTLIHLHRKKVVAFCGRILYNNDSYYFERG